MSAPISAIALPCRFAGCTFGQPGGKCVNGISNPVDECPDYDPEVVGSPADPEIAKASATETSKSGGVPLHPSSALDERLAYEITRASPTRVVVISGIAKSGKTTLITSIYDRFNDGRIGDYSFGGSRTIHAFEEWCHDSRDVSEREQPETLRTPFTAPGEQRFLHLCIRRASTREARSIAPAMQDLLITDLHGEKFERVRDDAAAAAGLTVLPRADHFVQLVDGAKLLDSGERHETIADARRILQSCFEAGAIGTRTIVHLVATKWDMVRASGRESSVRAFWEGKVEALSAMAEGRVGGFAAHITAARVPLSADASSWGVNSLLTSWIEESKQKPEEVRDGSVIAPPIREFDRFGARFE
jgi:hypothetical protein